jgi:DNA-binding NtrC family response regulator
MSEHEWKKTINVLLIEDNLDLLEMEEIQMRANGYENIFLAKNSDEAEDVLKNHKIDLCLSDIKFPTKDGVAVMKNAKIQNQTPGILIFMSGFNDYKIAELKAVGACEYFEKPVSFKVLLPFIEQQFEELSKKKAA